MSLYWAKGMKKTRLNGSVCAVPDSVTLAKDQSISQSINQSVSKDISPKQEVIPIQCIQIDLMLVTDIALY